MPKGTSVSTPRASVRSRPLDLALATLVQVLLPVAVVAGVGAVAGRRLALDATTLLRLNCWVLVPALCAVQVLRCAMPAGDLGAVALHALIFMAGIGLLGWLAAGPSSWGMHADRPVLALAAMLHNAGNFGIPFTALAFGAAWVPITALVVVVQNIVGFTVGIMLLGTGRRRWSGLLRLPVLWAVLIPLLLRLGGLSPPAWLERAAVILHDGLVPLALLTLGVQLAHRGAPGPMPPLVLAVGLRLLGGPALAFLLARLLGFAGEDLLLLTLIGGFPAAVNVAVIAGEAGRGQVLAGRTVLWSSLGCVVTLPLLRALL